MITIHEIRAIAAKIGLSNAVIEKDYILGWLLWGINQHPLARTGFLKAEPVLKNVIYLPKNARLAN